MISSLLRTAINSPPARLVSVLAVIFRSWPEWILPSLSRLPVTSSSEVPAVRAPPVLVMLLKASFALASDETLPRALSSAPVDRARSWPAPMRPDWLSMDPVSSMTCLPIRPRAPAAVLPAPAMPLARVSRFFKLPAVSASALSAWIRPALLSSVPCVLSVRPLAATMPRVLDRLCALSAACPCAAMVPPALSIAPTVFRSNSPPLATLPPLLARLAASMPTVPPYRPPDWF
ncbi:hypothetical protein LMG26842_04433 [Achromobacter dolens]|nr:hypothetical protein LMG26842_04433 [Achromobacter dolens]